MWFLQRSQRVVVPYGYAGEIQRIKVVVFERHFFRQAIQETNKPSLNFVTRFCTLDSTCEFSDPNIEIRDQFIDNCSSNRLRRRLLQEPNLTLEEVVKKAEAMELAEKQSIFMQPDDMQAGMAWLKVTQDKYDFPSNRCCFCCESSTHLSNKWERRTFCGRLQIKTSDITC